MADKKKPGPKSGWVKELREELETCKEESARLRQTYLRVMGKLDVAQASAFCLQRAIDNYNDTPYWQRLWRAILGVKL